MTLKSKSNYGVFVTASNREFLTIYQILTATKSSKGVRYAKAVIKNSEVIAEHLKSIEEMAVPSEAFIDLSLKAQEFIKAEDSEGLKNFESVEGNKVIIEERKAQMEKVNQKLDEVSTLELVMINETLLPDDLSAEQVEGLMKIIQ